VSTSCSRSNPESIPDFSPHRCQTQSLSTSRAHSSLREVTVRRPSPAMTKCNSPTCIVMVYQHLAICMSSHVSGNVANGHNSTHSSCAVPRFRLRTAQA
jgi:hypothetical protein